MPQGQNLYVPTDEAAPQVTGPKVFLSHRNPDKPIARAIGALLKTLGVHYWLDEEDRDVQRAAALGLIGEAALVHAIERGVRHSTMLLGLLSARTEGSWWVPYEIGYSRAAGVLSSFVMLGHDRIVVPEYATIAAIYWSADELARWASVMGGRDLHAPFPAEASEAIHTLGEFIRLDPPQPDVTALCNRARRAIALLANPETQSLLALTSDRFDWLPTKGGPIRELAYDLLAPLAYVQLRLPRPREVERRLELAYRLPTLHYEIATRHPALPYQPECAGWKHRRYATPAENWMQGLRGEQLEQRLATFMTARDRNGALRLATLEEFKAEFDRVVRSGDEAQRRSLGVLINPLLGFTPERRPVYWRILAIQDQIYSSLAGGASPFEPAAQRVAQEYLGRTLDSAAPPE